MYWFVVAFVLSLLSPCLNGKCIVREVIMYFILIFMSIHTNSKDEIPDILIVTTNKSIIFFSQFVQIPQIRSVICQISHLVKDLLSS